MGSETVPRRLLTSGGQSFERDLFGCLALKTSRHGTRMGKSWLLRGSLTKRVQNVKKKKIGFRNSSAPIVDKRGSSAPGAASRLAAAKPYRQILGAGIFYEKKRFKVLEGGQGVGRF